MSSILNIIPALAFLLILLSISAYIQRTSKGKQAKGFCQGLLHRRTHSRRLRAGDDHRCHLQQRQHLRRRSGRSLGYRLRLAVHGYRAGSRYLPRFRRIRQKDCPHRA